jgi:DNA-directed RNA polymerase subunit RPC12/RpoP
MLLYQCCACNAAFDDAMDIAESENSGCPDCGSMEFGEIAVCPYCENVECDCSESFSLPNYSNLLHYSETLDEKPASISGPRWQAMAMSASSFIEGQLDVLEGKTSNKIKVL